MALALDIDKLFKRRLLMVGGKGGVGKSTLAASLAVLAADRGLKTLLVSTDPAHNLSDLFECRFSQGRPAGQASVDWGKPSGKAQWRPQWRTRWKAPLQIQELNPQAALDDYLESVRKQMLPQVALGMRGALEKQLHLTRHSPGAEEAALLDVMTRLIQQRDNYDLIIFDTAPTGHTLRLLSLPGLMSTWASGLISQKKRSGRFRDVLSHLKSGADINNPLASADEAQQTPPALAPLLERQKRFSEAAAVLKNPAMSGFVFVMTPENLPLQETRRAIAALEESGMSVLGLLLNRLLPAEAAQIDFLRGAYEQQESVLSQVSEHLQMLPQVRLPMTGNKLQGRDGLLWLAGVLEEAARSERQKQKLPDSEATGQ
ncbi:ArsA family ATPase [uncultured Microbulbifer sp.]|uniref:ArsA family ATPase n=1 Tax=uncultured Microbulbifer sp. TaxID=348147 RepID=UPI002606AEAE|nr:ArsA family ATPase [uncultured Microbulbifer sp.]